jgi:carboxymethylenebutenolidase
VSDLAATFDAHTKAEFEDLDLEATMATMSGDPYVHHVPTITGGNGTDGVREFYERHFIGQWPDDTETRQISRTVGEKELPVTGGEQAESLLDQDRAKNELLG